MKKYSSNKINTFFYFTISFLFVGILIAIPLTLIIHFHLPSFSFIYSLVFIVAFSLCFYVYAGFVNNDVVVFDDKIVIENRLKFFKKLSEFRFDKIEEIVFHTEHINYLKDKNRPNFFLKIFYDWILIFIIPADYKCIKIKTDRLYKFYCFGIEVDYFENETTETIQNLFTELKQKKVKVKWKNNYDKYYKSMNEA